MYVCLIFCCILALCLVVECVCVYQCNVYRWRITSFLQMIFRLHFLSFHFISFSFASIIFFHLFWCQLDTVDVCEIWAHECHSVFFSVNQINMNNIIQKLKCIFCRRATNTHCSVQMPFICYREEQILTAANGQQKHYKITFLRATWHQRYFNICMNNQS